MKYILKLRAGHYVHLDSYPRRHQNLCDFHQVKQILKLGNNRYIHLDSYESNETRGSQALVLVLSIIISALTVGALIGADLTQTQHEINSYGHRNSR
jgi:hypothetical protein